MSTVHEAWTVLLRHVTLSRKEHRGVYRCELSCWVVRPGVREAGLEGGSEQMRSPQCACFGLEDVKGRFSRPEAHCCIPFPRSI